MSTKEKIEQFCLINNKYFGEENIYNVKNMLENLDDVTLEKVMLMSFKSPLVSLLISLNSGFLGIDRFYIGDTLLGIFKLITFGGFFIWSTIDLFFIMKATRYNNFNKLSNFINMRI